MLGACDRQRWFGARVRGRRGKHHFGCVSTQFGAVVNVVVDDGAIVEGSVIMPGTAVGGAVVRHAILTRARRGAWRDGRRGSGRLRRFDQRRSGSGRRASGSSRFPSLPGRRRRTIRTTANQCDRATSTARRTRIDGKTSPTPGDYLDGDSTGAAMPAVATLAAGRTVDFVSDTLARSPSDGDGNPLTRGTNAPGSVTRTSARRAEPNTCRLPSAGRTSDGVVDAVQRRILSATISTTSSTATIVSRSSHAQPCGGVTRWVNRDSRPSASSKDVGVESRRRGQ